MKKLGAWDNRSKKPRQVVLVRGKVNISIFQNCTEMISFHLFIDSLIFIYNRVELK